MKFGVMGCAHPHVFSSIEDLLKLNWEFVGIYDDKQKNVSVIEEKYDCEVFSKEEDFFSKDIDLVLCSSINNLKIDIIEICEKNKTHILCDKPIATNRDSYNRLEKVINNNIIKVGLLLTMRFQETVVKLKQLIDDGVLGKLINIEIFNPHKLHPENRPEWHFKTNENGGILIDLLIHSIDLFQFLTNDTINKTSSIATKTILPEYKDFYDSANAAFVSKKGILGYARVDWLMPETHWSWGDARIFCQGSKGCAELRITGDPISKKPMFICYSSDGETKKIDLSDIKPITATIDFINNITGKDHCITGDEILSACKVNIDINEKAEFINRTI